MKFSDMILAVASSAVILIFLSFILELVFIPTLGWDLAGPVDLIVSMLLGGLIVGAIFSRKIWEEEAGVKTIAKIVILGSSLLILFYAASIPSQGDWTPSVKESYQSANPGKTLTTFQWFMVEDAALIEEIAINVFIGIVTSFIGLYAGSMLRKPKKTQ